MSSLLDTPAFDFDQLQFDWGEVILAAIGWGEWQRVERTHAESLAWLRAVEAGDERVDDQAVAASVTAFRRTRRLLAGEDYLHWLSERSLAPGDVRAYFARNLVSERVGERSDTPIDGLPVEPGVEFTEMMRVTLIIGGWLHQWAERLARCAAAARGLEAAGVQPQPASSEDVEALIRAAGDTLASGLHEAGARERAPRVLALQAAADAFANRILTRDRLERCLSEHQLDWQHFTWEEVRFPAEGAAREAALLVREDGLALDEVAGLARVSVDLSQAYADGISELSGRLTAAAPGELVGPLDVDGDWLVLRLCARKPPTIEDPVLRDRATAELVDDALERHLAGRVRWHGQH